MLNEIFKRVKLAEALAYFVLEKRHRLPPARSVVRLSSEMGGVGV